MAVGLFIAHESQNSMFANGGALQRQKVGTDKAPALQGGRAESALMKPLRSRAVEQSTLSSPLRILAVADDGTVGEGVAYALGRQPNIAAMAAEMSRERIAP
jgi:hypothetical protein